MRYLYFVRHGETDYNKEQKIQGRGIDAPLNETGITQSYAVAAYFDHIPATRIITSSLQRSLETAAPLLERKKAAVVQSADLDEMDYGELEGAPFYEVKDKIEWLHTRWSAGNLQTRPIGGENPLEVFARAHYRVKKILEETSDTHLVFIVHGRLLRILFSEWFGYGMKNMDKIKHANGAINHLTGNGDLFIPLSLNITSHLP